MPKQKLIYPLLQIDRIGQLAGETFFLRNLFPEHNHELTLVTLPVNLVPRANKAVFKIVTRGLNLLHTLDERIVYSGHRYAKVNSGQIKKIADCHYFLHHPVQLNYLFLRDYGKREKIYPFQLNQTELAKGAELKRRMGIPATTPVVTLHVREGGYLPSMQYHSYRDSDINNYRPAISYLIEQGYFVVRLGDDSMQALDGFERGYLEVWRHQEYDDLADPYFISVSDFFIGASSGPQSLAKGFGVPSLTTNAVVAVRNWQDINDLILFKRYFSNAENRELSYEEILSTDLINGNKTAFFAEKQIELHENSAEEILRGVREMEQRLRGSYQLPADAAQLQERVREIHRKVHLQRVALNESLEFPFLAAHLFDIAISVEFLKASPTFIG